MVSAKHPQPLPIIPKAHDVMPIIRRHIEAERALLDHIIAHVDVSNATFDNVIKPIADANNVRAGEQEGIWALRYYSSDLDCHRAVEEAQAALRQHDGQNRPELLPLFRAVQAKDDLPDQESRKLLRNWLRGFEHRGEDILDSESVKLRRERLNRIKELGIEFERNLRENATGETFKATELKGVPQRDREPADDHGNEFYSHKTKTNTILAHAHDQEVRKRMLIGEQHRFTENVAIFRELLLLRDECARELKLPNHAHARLPYRTVESIEWVDSLLTEVTKAILPMRQAEFDKVVAVQCREEGGQMMPWDFSFYKKKLDRENHIDTAVVAEYFPLWHTVSTMLDIFAACLLLRFDPVDPAQLERHVWHKDVKAWSVWDERPTSKGEFVGYLYTDLLSRPNKHMGNQSVTLRPGYLDPSGQRVYPANLLKCNFKDASATTGCLLSHANIVTLFHELGHSVHDLVARTKYAQFHGWRVSVEFGEGMGMMLEQFCRLPSVLETLNLHYTRTDPVYMDAWKREHPEAEIPPAKIPLAVLQPFLAQVQSDAAARICNAVFLAKFDLAVHAPPTRQALLDLDEVAIYRELYQQYKFRPLVEGSNDHVNFYHLVSGGLDAGYYAFTCAFVFAADMFVSGGFSHDPFSVDAWQRFRNLILEPGGSQNEMDMLKRFLGRLPNTKALLSTLKT